MRRSDRTPDSAMLDREKRPALNGKYHANQHVLNVTPLLI
jgi:hypothetical protein